MNPTIQQILALAGPMPDAEAHHRYLARLTPRQLAERCSALQEERLKTARPRPLVEFWKRRPDLEVAA